MIEFGETLRKAREAKAEAAAASHRGSYILAADTLVSLDEKALGKPKDRDEAVNMLNSLSGKTHQVYTGVTLIAPDGRIFTDVDRTSVTFCDISENEILAYVASGEPMDKAGAYALQGKASVWVSHIDGSDTSVIGLPLYLVRRVLIQASFTGIS